MAFHLVSYSSYTHIDECLSYIYLLHLRSIKYFHVRGSVRSDVHAGPKMLVTCSFMAIIDAHIHDVTLSGNTV